MPSNPEESTKRMIHLIALIIGITILGIMAFEVVLGIPPTGIEALAVATLVVIYLWIKENA